MEWILECQASQQRVTCMLDTSTDTANAYRSELTGIYSALLFVSIICEYYHITNGLLPLHCDCKAALQHSSPLHTTVSNTIKHADLIRQIRIVRSTIPITIKFCRVNAHQDDKYDYFSLLSEVKLNIDCDLIAKAGLRWLHTHAFCQPDHLPTEQVIVRVGGFKPTGNIGPAIRDAHSRRVMKR